MNLEKMNTSWDVDLMDMLTEAKAGNRAILDDFLTRYQPLVACNEDYSCLLVLRGFKVQIFQDERRVLNAKPENEQLQKGITITQSFNDGSSRQMNVYLPNEKEYTALHINKEEVIIVTSTLSYTTNITELQRKLHFFGKFTLDDISQGFQHLCNEIYLEKPPKKPIVKNKTVVFDVLGKLQYNEEYEWYEGSFYDALSTKNINLVILHTTPKKLEKLFTYAQEKIHQRFYTPMLLAMEKEMIELKNDLWLGEDEETGEEEPPITIEEFRQRISIEGITFYEDGSCDIYCNDDDLFFGHTIQISVNKHGVYKSANLAG